MTTLVVIGASLGGRDALARLVAGIPDGTPLAFAVVLHRGVGGAEGQLAATLQRYLHLPVCEAGDKDAIEPGRVHVAPADYHLLVERGRFALSTEAAVNFARPSVDVLFESAADVYGEEVASVVLTGMNDDGARGTRAVKAAGGTTFAQEPSTCTSPEMPSAAIATGAVDHVLDLDGIARRLVALS